MINNIKEFISILKKEGEVVDVTALVDPDLEIAEIHRRVISANGPALLFKNVKNSPYQLVTNLFGTKKRIDLAFGKNPGKFIETVAQLPEELLPPSLSKVWSHRDFLKQAVKVGLNKVRHPAILQNIETPPRLTQLPLLKTWPEDGGAFITLPLVLTKHPTKNSTNLGMYRIQRYSDDTTGLHMQIGKGGGFHLSAYQDLGIPMPVNISIGGPPALILAAICPLPEDVPELLFASLALGKKLPIVYDPINNLPTPAEAEFTLVGEVRPFETKPEGPFGDHYGYYSLTHDYPLFRCKALLHQDNPICAATVVGKPRQEDFFLGDYLQEILLPLVKLVMPAIKDLWSYGETGYHSLSAACVQERYKREAMASAFRILGEGQLSLTKFLLVVDRKMDLKDFKSVLQYILARADFRTDLYLFSNLSMDSLDYSGPKINEGSKGVLLGVGDPIRELSGDIPSGIPSAIKHAAIFCPGCLVVEGQTYEEDPKFAEWICNQRVFDNIPLIVLVDDANRAAKSEMNFLWTTFTRFEPAADIYAKHTDIVRNHLSYTGPIVIDARMKSWYPKELFTDPETKALVTKRWSEYFPGGLEMGDSDLAHLG